MGRLDSVKRNLRRQKRRALPAEPKSLADLQINGYWFTTGGHNLQPFLIYDNGVGNSRTNADIRLKRMLIVASTEQMMRQLAIANQWFMDGTFSVAPHLFTELYAIRAVVGDMTVS